MVAAINSMTIASASAYDVKATIIVCRGVPPQYITPQSRFADSGFLYDVEI